MRGKATKFNIEASENPEIATKDGNTKKKKNQNESVGRMEYEGAKRCLGLCRNSTADVIGSHHSSIMALTSKFHVPILG